MPKIICQIECVNKNGIHENKRFENHLKYEARILIKISFVYIILFYRQDIAIYY